MAEGKWVRVNVAETGMHFISNKALADMGFSDPAKVNVYGFGGRMMSENLTNGMTDDLPAAPAMHTSGGIVFFATDNFSWRGTGKLTHTINPYSSKSHYFLSDCPAPDGIKKIKPTFYNEAPLTTVFTEYLVHEQDINAPGENGRDLMGEELRSGQSRNFSFATPGIADGKVKASIAFGANIRGGQSSVIITANGVKLPSTNSDKLDGVTSSSGFLTTRTTTKDIDSQSDKLDLNIAYSASGTFYGAWIDYIEVSYNRNLSMTDGELHFYINATTPRMLSLSGVSKDTKIWNVTDPMNPVEIDYELSGSSARFGCEGGMLEFVAFDPSKVKRNVTDPVETANQNIHAMEVPDYVIITPPEYMEAAERLANLHRRADGLTVHVLTPDKLYNEFSSGMQEPTAFRRAFKMWHDRGNAAAEGNRLRYVLLFARPTFDNKQVTPAVRQAGYPRLPQWLSTGIYIDDTAFGTDDYIGMLDDTENFRMARATVNIAVGRMAVTSAAEAMQMVDKIEKYTLNPDLGAWRNSVLLIADDGDSMTHMTQSDAARAGMLSNGNGSNFVYERLYTDAYTRKPTGTGLGYPDAKARMEKRLNEGVGFMQYIGHANPKGWTHENLFIWNDILAMKNTRLPFLAAYCCDFMRWDANALSGGEKMWLHPASGVIGMFCATRSVFMGPNGRLSTAFGKALYGRDKITGKAKRWGDVMVEAKNNADNYDDNKLRFALLGDPAMKVLSPEYTVTVDKIGETDLGNADAEYPELGAGGRTAISGSVLNPDGTLASDYNGIVELTLYDAEVPVTTNGWASDEFSYNERSTKLNSIRVRAKEGKWATDMAIPIEITNNYSPALLNIYAYSDDGREANGACDHFYVYGYDSDAEPDTEGPEITRFVLNGDGFTDGSPVSTSPVVMASFSDASGINVSDAGIGHRMSLTLDGKKSYEDINQYYLSDPDDSGSGSVTYPLSDLEPGEHKLELTVWDNAGNSSRRALGFQVAVGVNPTIYEISTDCNPARTSVVFTVTTDRSLSALDCIIDVFDLGGRKVWSSKAGGSTDSNSNITLGWDLRDGSGARVPRGIYLYRATITTPEGMTQTKTRKLAVTAE